VEQETTIELSLVWIFSRFLGGFIPTKPTRYWIFWVHALVSEA